MTRRPRVSVIIPTCGRAPLVVEAIESVLAQTFRDLEVVVCDDGSADDTGARVRALGAPVRYLYGAHSGRPGAVRNRGAAAAEGDLLAFLDDDDLWVPQKLARQIDRLDDEPGTDVVYSDRCVILEDGARLDGVRAPDPDARGRLLDEVLAGRFPSPCSMLIRREALRRAGGWDETLVTGEDLALWLRLGRGARAARVPESLVTVRRRSDGVSDRSGPDSIANAILVLERELGAGALSVRQRLRCRRTLALLQARLAAALASRRDWGGARRAALRGVARFPASRNAWRAAARVWRRRA